SIPVFWFACDNAGFTCATDSGTTAGQNASARLFYSIHDGFFWSNGDGFASLCEFNFEWFAVCRGSKLGGDKTFGVQCSWRPAHTEVFDCAEHSAWSACVDKHVGSWQGEDLVEV